MVVPTERRAMPTPRLPERWDFDIPFEAAVVKSQAMDGRSGTAKRGPPTLAKTSGEAAIKDDRTITARLLQALLQQRNDPRGRIRVAGRLDDAAGALRGDGNADVTGHRFALAAMEQAVEESASRFLGDRGVDRNLIGMRGIIVRGHGADPAASERQPDPVIRAVRRVGKGEAGAAFGRRHDG